MTADCRQWIDSLNTEDRTIIDDIVMVHGGDYFLSMWQGIRDQTDWLHMMEG